MNIVVVDGRMINAPVVRKVEMQRGSTTVVSFSIINENGKNKSLFNCESWGPVGKDVMKFQVGDTVCVSGVLNQQSWEDKVSGEKKSSVKIRANQVVKATLPTDVADDDSSAKPGYSAPAPSQAPTPRRETVPASDPSEVFDSVDF